MIGKELAFDKTKPLLERLYISLLGVPIKGLRIRARRILPHISAASKNILDSGCGQGIFTFEIARRFPNSRITGIDIDASLIERNSKIAETAGLKNCSFHIQDITEVIDRKEYDLILSIDNLEHIEEDEKVLTFFYKSLLPGGELLLHVPGYYRRWFFFKWKVNFEVDGHFRPGYELDDIVRKIEKSGLTVEEKYYTYGWLETLTNNISYVITGARMKHKYIYAAIFPFLLIISYFGKNSKPKRGAGILIKARKTA
ncbi:Trans-aconitate 2-methyltransferase [subsurface metagenome]